MVFTLLFNFYFILDDFPEFDYTFFGCFTKEYKSVKSLHILLKKYRLKFFVCHCFEESINMNNPAGLLHKHTPIYRPTYISAGVYMM